MSPCTYTQRRLDLKYRSNNISVNSLMWSTVGLNWYLETSRLLLQPSGCLDMFLMCLLKQLMALELFVILVKWFFFMGQGPKNSSTHNWSIVSGSDNISPSVQRHCTSAKKCWKVETVGLQTRQFSCLACGLLPRSSFSYNDEADYV